MRDALCVRSKGAEELQEHKLTAADFMLFYSTCVYQAAMFLSAPVTSVWPKAWRLSALGTEHLGLLLGFVSVWGGWQDDATQIWGFMEKNRDEKGDRRQREATAGFIILCPINVHLYRHVTLRVLDITPLFGLSIGGQTWYLPGFFFSFFKNHLHWASELRRY